MISLFFSQHHLQANSAEQNSIYDVKEIEKLSGTAEQTSAEIPH